MPTEALELDWLDGQQTRQPLVLIVDDDDALTDVLSLRLKRQGFQTRIATSGQSALSLARKQRPGVILLDVRLPDVDGLELCQQLVDDPVTAEIPVIILSGLARPDIIRSARAAGGCFFIRKPYDPVELTARIHAHLQRVAFLRQVSGA